MKEFDAIIHSDSCVLIQETFSLLISKTSGVFFQLPSKGTFS